MVNNKETSRLSRREFLRHAGLLVAGVTLGSSGLLSSCGGSSTTSQSTGTGDAANDPIQYYKVTHQWANDDVRDRMMKAFCSLVTERTGGSIQFYYYPNQMLFKARETWDALRSGACDMAVLPLDYASGKVPELSITLLPCMVQSIEQGLSWKDKPVGKAVDDLMLEFGVRHVIWAWCDGAPGSKKHQIKLPQDVKGDKIRAAGRKVEYMFQQAGATINSMPSAEIYSSLATGVLDSALTSSASWVTFRLYEQAKYINVPRDNCMWFMEEGMLMSEMKYQRMTTNQKRIFHECSKEIQDNWVLENFKKDTEELVRLFTQVGAELHYMTKSEWDIWNQYAQDTSWKEYEATNAKCKELLGLAKAARV